MRESVTISPDELSAIRRIKQGFDAYLAIEENPLSLIKLAKMYFHDLLSLSAFLWWLLDNRISAQSIIDSGFLHHFFIEHISNQDDAESILFFKKMPAILIAVNKENVARECDSVKSFHDQSYSSEDIDQVSETFELNSDYWDTLDDLVTLARKTYCGIRGTTFDKPADGKFISTNLFNEEFTHDHSLERIVIEKNELGHECVVEKHYVIPALPPFDFCYENELVDSLYRLFQLNFITLLDFTNKHHIIAFDYLKQNNAYDMLFTLKQAIISQTLDVGNPTAFVQVTACLFSVMHKNEFYNLLSKNYFFLYFAACNNHLISMLTENKLKKCLNPVFANHTATPSIIMLTALFNQLEKDTQNYTSSFILTMQENIFEFAMRSENLSDDEIFALKKLSGIQTFCINKIKGYEKALEKCFDDKKGVYDAFELEWLSFLSQMNAIKKIFPDVFLKTHYPFSSNALKALFIEHQYRKTAPPRRFNLNCILRKFPLNALLDVEEKKATHRRILLDALVFIKNSELLLVILRYLTSHYFECDHNNWVQLRFGDNKSIFEKAIYNNNLVLCDLILDGMSTDINFLHDAAKKVFELNFFSEDMYKKIFFAIDAFNCQPARQSNVMNYFTLVSNTARLARPPYDFCQILLALKFIEQSMVGGIRKLSLLMYSLSEMIKSNRALTTKALIDKILIFKNLPQNVALSPCLSVLLLQVEAKRIDFDLLRQSQSAESLKRSRNDDDSTDDSTDDEPLVHRYVR